MSWSFINGWMAEMPAERSRILWLMLVLLSANAIAEEPSAADSAPSPPSLELLEFLGEWETDNSDWVDPSSLLLESDIGPQK